MGIGRGVNATLFALLLLCSVWKGVNSFLVSGKTNTLSRKSIESDRYHGDFRTAGFREGSSAAVKTSSTSLNASFWRKSWPRVDPKGVAPDFPLTMARVGVTLVATLGTLYAQHVGHSNVMASAAITLVCSMFFDKRLGQAAFCGSFAGMCSSSIVSSPVWAMILAILTASCFEVFIHTKNVFLGIGGRLGATAFIATSIVALLQKVDTGITTISLGTIKTYAILKMMTWHVVGSVSTIALREASDESAASDPVRASAIIGLLAALVLKDKMAALGVYGGSFVGMSLPSRLMYGIIPGRVKEDLAVSSPSPMSILVSFAIAGGLGGLVHGCFNEIGLWSGAWGGKAGLFAFFGCFLFRSIAKVGSILVKKN